MIECAFVFRHRDGEVFHWHLPPGRTGGSIPDTRDLWEVMWDNRDRLGGVAHTHPWRGTSGPSGTDVTTFAACEAALGKRLVWPIVTLDSVSCFRWEGPDKHRYGLMSLEESPSFRTEDLAKLRGLSCGLQGPALVYYVLAQAMLEERRAAEEREDRLLDEMDDVWHEMSPEERELVGKLTDTTRG